MRPRIRRTRVVKVLLSDAEHAVVAERARAHRKRVATWARCVLLGEQGQAAKDADSWWDTLPPQRRAQVHRWVAGQHGAPEPIPGQSDLLEGLNA